jgi:hypothetical protein
MPTDLISRENSFDAATALFLRERPTADRDATREICETVVSAFAGATVTYSSSEDADTGKWHFYIDVDTLGERDLAGQLQRELSLHSKFHQNLRLRCAKEYVHVTVT